MADEPNVIPPSRFLRWLVLAVLIAAGVALYFRHGTRLTPFGAATSADSTR